MIRGLASFFCPRQRASSDKRRFPTAKRELAYSARITIQKYLFLLCSHSLSLSSYTIRKQQHQQPIILLKQSSCVTRSDTLASGPCKSSNAVTARESAPLNQVYLSTRREICLIEMKIRNCREQKQNMQFSMYI